MVPLDVLARAPTVASDASEIMLVTLPAEPPAKVAKTTMLVTAIQFAIIVAMAALIRVFLVRPVLRVIYRNGPAYELGLTTVGFWGGAPVERICAQLMGTTDISFWMEHISQCRSIFTEKEEAWLHSVEVSGRDLNEMVIRLHSIDVSGRDEGRGSCHD